MKKHTLIIIILFTLCLGANAQVRTRFDSLCNKLNWESFGVIPNYASATYRFDNIALEIIKDLPGDKKKVEILLGYLNDSTKVVSIHAILTKVFCPKKLSVQIKTLFATDSKGNIDYNNSIGNEFEVNGMHWKLIFNHTDSKYFYVSPSIDVIKINWKHQLKL